MKKKRMNRFLVSLLVKKKVKKAFILMPQWSLVIARALKAESRNGQSNGFIPASVVLRYSGPSSFQVPFQILL
jgi:hypothetical protein